MTDYKLARSAYNVKTDTWYLDEIHFTNLSQFEAYQRVKSNLLSNLIIVGEVVTIVLNKSDPYYTARRIFNLLGSNDRLVLIDRLIPVASSHHWKKMSSLDLNRIVAKNEVNRKPSSFFQGRIILFTGSFLGMNKLKNSQLIKIECQF